MTSLGAHTRPYSPQRPGLVPVPNPPSSGDDCPGPVGFDIARPQWSRVLCYWRGGKDHYAVDRDLGDLISAQYPQIIEAVRHHAAFQRRMVQHLAEEARLRQFLVIGTEYPTSAEDSVHEITHRICSGVRVVYTDSDRLVMAHARALLTSTRAAVCSHVEAPLTDTARIVNGAARTLDLNRPVAVLVLLRLHQIPRDDTAAAFMQALIDAAATGSRLVITHPMGGMGAALEMFAQASGQPMVTRSSHQIRALLHGLEITDPGALVFGSRPSPGPPPVDVSCVIGTRI